MRFDLSASALVNAGGAFLFLATGLVMLALGWRSRRDRLLGAFATAFGATYVVENLVEHSAEGAVVILIATLPSVFFNVWLVWEFRRGLPHRSVVGLVVYAILATLLFAAYALGAQFPDTRVVFNAFGFNSAGGSGRLAAMVLLAQQVTLLVMLGALALHVVRPERAEARRAALLSLTIGPFLLFLHLQVYGSADVAITTTAAVALVAGTLGLAILAIGTTIPFAFARASNDDPLVRAVFPVLLAAGAVSVVHSATTMPTHDDFGLYGIMRTLGVGFLLFAVFRGDLLGVPLPRFALHRGPVAAGALALLLIVAQVAENFLSTKYGLLMGSVVAGAFLFAANPVQRAAERLVERAAPSADPTTAAIDPEREEMYRSAVRLALQERRLTRSEERDLFRLARGLGIASERAHDILTEEEGQEAEAGPSSAGPIDPSDRSTPAGVQGG